ncbi:nucleotidyltransferase domain-containing protein [Clostridiisalibacter paucivorans]|uniref:nucleotidyltransferase domain-containing protein n=1 Tax=Clostridiisalibacter paucivorans TaxID=408753 RepID=UPI00047A1D82|nr:nucleotidyltransferase domain-containing protein [Clostridiisalibacter paucivorans]
MYGLLDRDLKFILEAIDKYSEIEEVVLFGSRAMGNYKKGSDVDLAIVGENIDRKILRRISDDLNEEYPLPYFFDVVVYKDISNEELKKHIDSVGKSIYKRNW